MRVSGRSIQPEDLLGKPAVLRSEDADATSDFAGAGSRAVRLCATKEDRPRATIQPKFALEVLQRPCMARRWIEKG
jgi:hypothetical protein